MIKDIVKSSPNFIKNPAKKIYNSIPDKLKYGKIFREKYNFLQESQWWSKEKLEEYQMNELMRLLNHAYENVPYYKKVFDDRGLKPRHIQNFNDLKQLPYLTKEIIQHNLIDLVAKNYNKKDLVYVTTGGSTGIPMGFYEDKRVAGAREWAFIAAQWSRIGYDISKKNRCVILRGNIPEKGLYEYNGKDLILSSYQLTDDNMKIYIDMIKKFEPDFIQAYPSSISILSDFILENNMKLNLYNLKAVICASENLYDFQRYTIEQAFKVRVYSFYGHTERACIGWECEKSNYYHLQSEYGYTELINKNGDDVTEENEVGEIVATGFNNYVVPFIRYKTMDLAVNTNETCSCGRNYKIIKKIQGREQEQIVTRDGAKIAMTSIIFAQHFKAFGKIQMMQLYQDQIGKVVVNIVPKEKLNSSDINEIISRMSQAANNKIDVKVKIVESIERTKAGKHKFLIQKLKV